MSREETHISTARRAQLHTSDSIGSAPAAPLLSVVALVVAIIALSVWIACNPQWILALGHWGYLGAFLIGLVSSATVILPAPGIALLIAMGTAVDPLLIGVAAAAGSATGELTGYFAGATGAALISEERLDQFERIHLLTGKYGAAIIFVLASIPFPFFDLAGIIAGMLRMPIPIFLGAVFAGNSIKYIVVIWLGAGPLFWLLQTAYASLGGF